MKTLDDLSDADQGKMYMDTWRESLIPLCANRSGNTPHLCSEFEPSLSNRGICFTKGQAPVHEIYRTTPYFKMFNATFLSERDAFPVLKNKGSGMRYKNSFLINANQVMDLKNGLAWNQNKRAIFRLGVHPNIDMPEIRDMSIKIYAGFKTTVRVNTMQLESDDSIKKFDVKTRNCKFISESDELLIFKSYSR